MPTEIIEVKFKGERKELFKNPQQFPFRVGDFAIVKAEKGNDLGRINQVTPLLGKKAGAKKLKEVVRKANANEMAKLEENRRREVAALELCKQKLEKHKLNMKLVDCEFQFDSKKITFFFTAEKRVDFRELVKDLAAKYRTRIEFRQIGARDEARRKGGFGVCGRSLCCSCWLQDFSPVTTQAAREQNLTLNPSKLAGVCGRLKCCLMYERDFYNQAIAQFPELAKPIVTERGEGIVENIDIFNEKVVVKYPDETVETITLDYVKTKVYKCENDCGHGQGNLAELN
ncbi:MAG: stage 0 sporulation family protein [bacterium]